MSQLNTLLESAAGSWKNLQSDAAKLAGKWENTGLLEGISRENEKNSMSMLLENQAKQLVVEQSSTAGGTAHMAAGTGENWAGIALPLVRKVFGQIAAQEFVSVQPMNLPSGLVFYLDFQYGSDKLPFASGDSLYGTPSANFGNEAEGGLYGAGRFSYSTNEFVAAGTAIVTGSVDWEDVKYDSDLSASVAAGALQAITVDLSAVDFDANAVRSFVITGSSVASADVLAAFTSVSGDEVTFIAEASAAAVDTVDVYYTKDTDDNRRGDFEAGNSYATSNDWDASTSDISIPELNIQMKSEAIVAKTKKLKAVWTPEFAQDLNAYQALDAEAEVTNMLSEYISLEIDLEILDMLIQDAAAGDEFWSARNNRTLENGEEVVDASGFYNTQGGWFQTLGTKMQKLSNKIHQRTLRGGANFVVVSPTVATIIESIPGFASNSDGDVSKASYAFGVQKAGTMNSRYTVYKNPYMKENTILMGFRGSQFLEAGAVFAPYIPLIMTPLVYDPDTFTPRKGLLTRYAKKMLRPEFYGRIYVSGLNTL